MSVLEAEPYNLQRRDVISDRVVISAYNEVGFGEKSQFSASQEVTMPTRLPPTFMIKSLGSAKDSAVLSWDFFADQTVTYHIYQALEVGPFRMIKTTKETRFMASKLSSGVTYRFKVSA